MPTRIVILGSTGSIGRQTLQVVEQLPQQFEVIGLAGGRGLERLEEQVRRFRPRMVSADIAPEEMESRLGLRELGATVVSPEEMASSPEADVVVLATAGRAGFAPGLAAARAGKVLALANKEVLVMAGELLLGELTRHGGVVRPVDSEHSALWQCLLGECGVGVTANSNNLIGVCDLDTVVRRLILTASGGAFRDFSSERLAGVTSEQALCHPTWLMGPKVTIDSATLINKGLEVIEAHWLFGVPFERIEVVLHRESVIHSFVEFVDGSLKAQLGIPDMRLPIQYALTYPDRRPSGLPSLELARLGSLTFQSVDEERFPGLRLAIEAGRRGGTYPAAMAAADEMAVDLFRHDQIGFTDIPRLIDAVLQTHVSVATPSLADVLEADEWARRKCLDLAMV
ncbi:MAG: 1-deoxy-D-xylulose-5-phosphate reductoisomerase [Chloroflexota bacterium]